MTAFTLKLDPSTPQESVKNVNLQQRFRVKLNNVKSVCNSINNIKENATFSKDKNQKSNKKDKKLQKANYNKNIKWYVCYYCFNVKFFFALSQRSVW